MKTLTREVFKLAEQIFQKQEILSVNFDYKRECIKIEEPGEFPTVIFEIYPFLGELRIYNSGYFEPLGQFIQEYKEKYGKDKIRAFYFGKPDN